MGRALTQLKAQDLATFELPPSLSLAIEEHGRIKSREGSRRQLQYIGRLMRKLDTEAIERQLQHLRGEFLMLRGMPCTSLSNGGTACLRTRKHLTELLREQPHIDRQKLRQLLKRVTSADSANANELQSAQKKAARALFRFLREQLETSDTF